MTVPVDRPPFAARVLPAFSIAAAITYFVVMGFGAPSFIYYPQIGIWSLARQEGVGPPMFFYGWLAEATLAGLAAAGLAALAPRPASAAWFRAYALVSAATPIVLTLAVLYFLRGYFGVGR